MPIRRRIDCDLRIFTGKTEGEPALDLPAVATPQTDAEQMIRQFVIDQRRRLGEQRD